MPADDSRRDTVDSLALTASEELTSKEGGSYIDFFAQMVLMQNCDETAEYSEREISSSICDSSILKVQYYNSSSTEIGNFGLIYVDILSSCIRVIVTLSADIPAYDRLSLITSAARILASR